LPQQLYEGVAIHSAGTVGLITYMRTDSTNVSEMAQNEVRKFIVEQYGGDFLPTTPPQYKTRTLGAQKPLKPSAPHQFCAGRDDVYRRPDS
jgi:DNA topoisomerase-1